MGKIDQNALTVRFLEDYDKAWKSGLFKNQADFCEKTGADKASLSLVLNGSRNAPMTLVQKLRSIYGGVESSSTPIDLIIKYENLKKDYEALDIKYKALDENYKRALQDLDYFKGLVNTLSGNKSDFKANRKVG